MADFDGWDADGGEAGGPVQAAGTPAVNGGLLDPRTFPASPAPSTQEAPSIEPAAPELSGPLDTDVHQQVLQDILNAEAKLPPIVGPTGDPTGGPWIERLPPLFPRGLCGDTPAVNGGLLDPRTFSTSGAPLASDGPPLERPDPEITGPLRTDYGSDVLQDILNAQAKLNGQGKAPQLALHPETWSVNGRTYHAIGAHGFDPTLSTRLTVMPTPAQDAAAWAGMSQVATPSGIRERGGSIRDLPAPPTAADVDPITGLVTKRRFQPMVLRAPGARAGGDDKSATLEIDRVDGVAPLIHSHIDSGEYQSDGMLDEPSANGGPGDASSLLSPYPVPMATVSHGQIGWHVLDDGRLKFLYPPGSMTSSQIGEMQDKLSGQQRLLQRLK